MSMVNCALSVSTQSSVFYDEKINFKTKMKHDTEMP